MRWEDDEIEIEENWYIYLGFCYGIFNDTRFYF